MTEDTLEAGRTAHASADWRSAFDLLTALAASGKLVFPVEVLNELKRWAAETSKDLPFQWAKQNASAARRTASLERVREVLSVVSDVLDKESQVEEADPYVLALALEIRAGGQKVVVVTEERKDRPDKLSMNTACGLLRVPCLPVEALLRELRG